MCSGIRKLDQDTTDLLTSSRSIECITTAVALILQNSVDSGAAEVEIVLDLANRAFTVIDDGCGMNRKDLVNFGQLHYSSKISNVTNLSNNLSTFGYRGRSVFDISNVAKVTTLSRTKNESNTWLRKPEGNIEKIDPALPWGTSVIVTDFFHNLPVRREALEKASSNRLCDKLRFLVFDVLVSHPETKITVRSDSLLKHGFALFESRDVHTSLSKSQKLSLCLFNVLGISTEDFSPKPVHARFQNYVVEGLVSTKLTTTKDIQLVYINGERCQNEIILKPIAKLFSDIRSQSRTKADLGGTRRGYYLFVLKASTPVSGYHGSGELSVRDWNQIKIVHSLIIKVVEAVFKTRTDLPHSLPSSCYNKRSHKETSLDESRLVHYVFESTDPRGLTTVGCSQQAIKKLRTTVNDCQIRHNTTACDVQNMWGLTPHARIPFENQSNPPAGSPVPDFAGLSTHREIALTKSSLRSYVPVSQIDLKFILLRSSKPALNSQPSLIMVDQHACDERIRLETMLNEFIGELLISPSAPSVNVQIEIASTFREFQSFDDYQHEFARWGIRYEAQNFTERQVLIKIITIPELLQRSSKHLLKDILIQHASDLRNFRKTRIGHIDAKNINLSVEEPFAWWKHAKSIPTILMDHIRSKACRSSIMFGQPLSAPECVLLIKMLSDCRDPFYCAHGRPSLVPLTTSDVDGYSQMAGAFNNKDYQIDN
ncbi:LANO_0H16094g1_1 [Lachancea nothofagi CBS 11611]|uniref:LANO_0H16094g1_1 n=1 Tax=Lachancea nothofagi CBS 11611 TaxID=1266666 RepID=A0A1G4KMV1_9SACH|nr:LANO_0H16094g1_1 [Lachancea nothofagi CBS 11611]